MSTITLAVNIELADELTEDELGSLTSALLMNLSKNAINTISEELTEGHRAMQGSVNIGVAENPIVFVTSDDAAAGA